MLGNFVLDLSAYMNSINHYNHLIHKFFNFWRKAFYFMIKKKIMKSISFNHQLSFL